MDWALYSTLFGLGLAGGLFSGLLGIGGGILMVPLLLYLPPLAHEGDVHKDSWVMDAIPGWALAPMENG